jgi:hypothetical protein
MVLTIRILLDEQKISTSELAFLLSPRPQKQPNPYSAWMPNEIWELAVAITSVSPIFSEFVESIKKNQSGWKTYLASTQAEQDTIPFERSLTAFQRLVILRVFHLHRVREGIRNFVSESLGPEFVTPPPLDLHKLFAQSSALSPMVFVITPGIDPVDEVLSVADAMDAGKYFKTYSLGRGRGDGAANLITEAREKGFWVLLQNCHLSLSWMPKLEHIIDNFDPANVHARFRLFLVTMSDPRFPIGILYQSTKLIYEIPKGIRENMLRIYSQINSDEYETDMPEMERQLTFKLALFHSVVLERLQFGSIGWNIPYEFNPSDFAISRRHLKIFLSEADIDVVPYEALSYVIGELNYGGRVTDAWDRRLLLSLLKQYFSPQPPTLGKRYKIPEFAGPFAQLHEVIANWPIVTAGEDVGLSVNASTITARNDAMAIFNSIVEIEPTLVVAAGSVSPEQFALTLVASLLTDVPAEFNEYTFRQRFDMNDAIDTVLYHQILLYNNLIGTIRSSLLTLQNGLKGLIVMDEALDSINRRLLANKIPQIWLDNSYPSVLTMQNYFEDLKARVHFLDHWLRTERPKVFRLSAFYHPEEFLTAILQMFARNHSAAFDSLRWATVVTDGNRTEPPEDGILVEGLFIEGAKWDAGAGCLVECGQTELISTLPIVHLLPVVRKGDNGEVESYECPLYRTQNRGTGALDLPNYIMSLDLAIGGKRPDHWIQRSVAVFVTVQP